MIWLSQSKLRIEAAAAKKQARIDSGTDVIVGVNKYVSDESSEAPALDLLKVNNKEVLASQIARLKSLKEKRDDSAVKSALSALEKGAAGSDNLLALTVEAMRARCTVGEVSDALERVFGRHKADTKMLGGVYASAYTGDDVDPVFAKVEEFQKAHGRRPRMLVVKMGQDGHDRGAKVIATAFADLGFDVDIGPLFQTPAEAAKSAVENDVHVVGVSSLAAGHRTLVPSLMSALKDAGASDIKVVCGGVIPPDDVPWLLEQGVACVFTPGTRIPDAAIEVLGAIG